MYLAGGVMESFLLLFSTALLLSASLTMAAWQPSIVGQRRRSYATMQRRASFAAKRRSSYVLCDEAWSSELPPLGAWGDFGSGVPESDQTNEPEAPRWGDEDFSDYREHSPGASESSSSTGVGTEGEHAQDSWADGRWGDGWGTVAAPQRDIETTKVSSPTQHSLTPPHTT